MSDIELTNPYKIAEFIKNSKKSTPVKAYIKGSLDNMAFGSIDFYGMDSLWILFGENEEVEKYIECNSDKIEKYHIEYDRRNSAIPLLDTRKVNARIEPGAIIRDRVSIGNNAVIMMGAIINIGAEIGSNTMIDMNAVLGARAIVGSNCHIGAGAVLAGVLEPPSSKPVVIEDNVLVGANAVVLEGVTVGKGSVVAAGSVVTKDVPPGTVVAGIPAKIIKNTNELDENKKELLDDLRK
ncbi:2,3,4,5-tetrahydropyridine-2,6-dicarboxylate N-acetyltransferase [Lutispora thermophila]|uniref:2,3,4,5-tetrahydropyridine-2,6-dicarboxylate N-acetyltransferase n=1 Tax=Lutispora thermophila DSM 19022 TaxID=1122184 RepID=A0A1M6GMG2_9FIRM|nr:2,3,4,5-tetrahydropyridine-2,6-dicarboxylate N-acetyltransferase [Lutispora thermophila]SHJ11102.1 2,3,4,5-tetrahydropyridine-2,6-dicarboxylate N-acetyltransferase [Lutispora thermophila DSM 19022]